MFPTVRSENWLVLGGLLLLVACAPRASPEPRANLAAPPPLPDEPSQLIRIAQQSFLQQATLQGPARSLAAARQALDLEPGNPRAAYLVARAALWLLEFDPRLSRSASRDLAALGLHGARIASRTVDVSGVGPGELAYLNGALQGFKIQHGGALGPVAVRQVEKAFREAVERDPDHQAGAPLRALGVLLVRAPPWPTGVGDLEEGLELLEEAVRRHPNHPANHLYRAEALEADARYVEARQALQRCRELCTGDAVPARTYARIAREALDRLPAGPKQPLGQP